jgi:hypothetical protein
MKIVDLRVHTPKTGAQLRKAPITFHFPSYSSDCKLLEAHDGINYFEIKQMNLEHFFPDYRK